MLFPLAACLSSPCVNGGSCKNKGGFNYECDCPPGYTGKDCNKEISKQTLSFYQSVHVSINHIRIISMFCCFIIPDECFGNKCRNGGQCIDMLGRYECACLPGYSGEYCETEIGMCLNDTSNTVS